MIAANLNVWYIYTYIYHLNIYQLKPPTSIVCIDLSK